MQPLQNCIGLTIRIGREILCLPYEGFLTLSLDVVISPDILLSCFPPLIVSCCHICRWHVFLNSFFSVLLLLYLLFISFDF